MGLMLLARTPPWEWPADSANTLLTVLRDLRADETKRLLAAELAGEVVVINDDLAATLLSIAGDASASEALRSRAALSLGPVLEQMVWDSFDDFPGFDEVLADDPPTSEHTFHRIRESLRARYLDDDVPQEVRRRILEASVRAPADWHRDAILEAYAHEDRDWRLTAAFAMAYVRGFDDQILATLDDPDVEIRREAVGAAGNWEVDGAWPYVAAIADRTAHRQGTAARRHRSSSKHSSAGGAAATRLIGRLRRRRGRHGSPRCPDDGRGCGGGPR